MDTIDECKNKGNDNFKRASAMGGSDPRAASLLKEACLQYAKSIEALGSWEINILEEGKDLNSDESFGKIEMLKPRLFLNLGMANAKLKEFVSCRRCCNVALLFCNESSTPLCDLPDILDDMAVLLPVAPIFATMVSKILFHRSRCLVQLNNKGDALGDLRLAHSLNPSDNLIKEATTKLELEMQENPKEVASECDEKIPLMQKSTASPEGHDRFAGGAGMINGGYCLERIGCWCQSVSEVTLTIPLGGILSSSNIDTKRLSVVFSTRHINILYDDGSADEEVLAMPLTGGVIVPTESTWYFLRHDKKAQRFGDETLYLIVVLCKQPPEADKTFPGCEWWTHVFEMDEKIDTLTCSIGADITALPRHALERAEREHVRFMALSEEEKADELTGIKNLKEAFLLSEKNTRDKALEEDRAYDEAPQRAPMLEALGNEFPHIQFSAK